uniref:Uncharacterized protein n=1 Tax=Glossina pallidipes TaxID=7398 RepID=A0A1A9ZJW9_GLOPL
MGTFVQMRKRVSTFASSMRDIERSKKNCDREMLDIILNEVVDRSTLRFQYQNIQSPQWAKCYPNQELADAARILLSTWNVYASITNGMKNLIYLNKLIVAAKMKIKKTLKSLKRGQRLVKMSITDVNDVLHKFYSKQMGKKNAFFLKYLRDRNLLV